MELKKAKSALAGDVEADKIKLKIQLQRVAETKVMLKNKDLELQAQEMDLRNLQRQIGQRRLVLDNDEISYYQSRAALQLKHEELNAERRFYMEQRAKFDTLEEQYVEAAANQNGPGPKDNLHVQRAHLDAYRTKLEDMHQKLRSKEHSLQNHQLKVAVRRHNSSPHTTPGGWQSPSNHKDQDPPEHYHRRASANQQNGDVLDQLGRRLDLINPMQAPAPIHIPQHSPPSPHDTRTRTPRSNRRRKHRVITPGGVTPGGSSLIESLDHRNQSTHSKKEFHSDPHDHVVYTSSTPGGQQMHATFAQIEALHSQLRRKGEDILVRNKENKTQL